MQALIEFILKTIELLEAEGRAAKRGAIRVGLALYVFFIATMAVMAGGACLTVAVYLGMVDLQVHPAVALLIVGVVLLMGAAGRWQLVRLTLRARGTSYGQK